jgi:hypothetical protein
VNLHRCRPIPRGSRALPQVDAKCRAPFDAILDLIGYVAQFLQLELKITRFRRLTFTVTEFARKGGLARAKELSKKRRREIATTASMAALDKRRRTIPTD